MFGDELIDEGKSKLKELLPLINKLHGLGISKEISIGNKSSHIVVTYPPIQKLDEFSGENIYGNFRNLSRKNTLYIHIPFCSGVCTYCNYSRSVISDKDEKIRKYLDLLDKESFILRSKIGMRKLPVESIYIGGGTPTLLNIEDLEKLLKIIKRDFILEDNIEYTLEGSPETITIEKIELAKEYDVNRVSLGIESFNDNVLKNIQRRHDSKNCIKIN